VDRHAHSLWAAHTILAAVLRPLQALAPLLLELPKLAVPGTTLWSLQARGMEVRLAESITPGDGLLIRGELGVSAPTLESSSHRCMHPGLSIFRHLHSMPISLGSLLALAGVMVFMHATWAVIQCAQQPQAARPQFR
jgi:hypothetical protein